MSEKYIVSARKYRPQTFDTVVGQEHITTTLKNAIRTDHLAHAFLFCGPRGVGKTTCARIFAKTINCENPTSEMEACGVCETCVQLSESASFNVFELDAASNNSVDDIRNLTDQVRFAPQQGKYKIYIIDEVHMLSTQAFNAFLKTLEEPPPYAIFILATTEKHKILPTILSRCQIFDFKRITTQDIVDHLKRITTKENIQADEASLHVIAQNSEGCMRDSLSMLDRIAGFTEGNMNYSKTMELLNLLDANFYFQMIDYVLAQDVSGTMLLLDSAMERGFEGDVIINGLSEQLRNLLVCKDQRMAKLLDVPEEQKKMYFDKANQMPPSYIISALHLLNTVQVQNKSITHKKLNTELALIRLCYIGQTMDEGSGASFNKEKKIPFRITPIKKQTETVTAKKELVSRLYIQEDNDAKLLEPESKPQEKKPELVKVEVGMLQTAVPTGSAPKSRRVSASLLADIGKSMEAAKSKEVKLFGEALVQNALDLFALSLKESNKMVQFAEFSRLKFELYEPDEVRFICDNDMTEGSIKDEKLKLITHFSNYFGKEIRITSELRIPEKTEHEEQHTVMSTQDKYMEIVKINPLVAELRNKLGLQIDYGA